MSGQGMSGWGMSGQGLSEPLHTVLRSATKEVVIGHDQRFCLIGERINPTGRRIFQEQLRAGDLSAIERDVVAQVEGGADVLDVNIKALESLLTRARAALKQRLAPLRNELMGTGQ